ncbi:MAG: isoprenylcysteine carboxylmethyltransferase family protein [Candidatus Heimdallarchaeota archaeon]|nr:MAG: isoprenylcysteine carboxylmethyltransferase family protein [Candidatus Heimdallarchaeota archaeon]
MNDRIKILLLMIFYLPVVFIILAAIIFFPANDFSWLEGWLFIIIFFTYAFLIILYFFIKDPEGMMKRGKYITDDPNTKSLTDKTFMGLAIVVFGFILVFSGIDHQLSLSPIPPLIELFGFIGLIISLIFISYVNKVNRYASKGLVIHKDHELITSGPYQFIRHPMYSGFIILIISVPVALGSFIAFVVSLIFPILLIYRIQIEEKMLMNHLPGYKDYMDRVRYRFIPKIY